MKVRILDKFVFIKDKPMIYESSLLNFVSFQHDKFFPYIKIYKTDGRVEIEMFTRKKTIEKINI
jgi:hypothetical protein